jgi:hypothetical protein
MTRAFFQFRRIFFCVPDGPASASASGERCAVDDYLKHRRITRRPLDRNKPGQAALESLDWNAS